MDHEYSSGTILIIYDTYSPRCCFTTTVLHSASNHLRAYLRGRLPSSLDTIRDTDAPNARANNLHSPAPQLTQRLPELPHAGRMVDEVGRYALLVPVHCIVHRRRERAAQMRRDEPQYRRDELRVRRI